MCFTLNISDLGFTKFTIIVLISAGRGRGGAGIKMLNPSPPCLGVRGQNIAHPRPTTFAGRGKPMQGGAGRVKAGQGKIAIRTGSGLFGYFCYGFTGSLVGIWWGFFFFFGFLVLVGLVGRGQWWRGGDCLFSC